MTDSGMRELNRRLQGLQSEKHCLKLENRRLLKKIEVLEEIKTALRKQQGKESAQKEALSKEMQFKVRDLQMKLEISESKLANASKMNVSVDELKGQLATAELNILQTRDQMKAVQSLKDDLKSKLEDADAFVKELCTLMAALWSKDHPDEHPPVEPVAMRDWIRKRMSSVDAAKLAAKEAEAKYGASIRELETELQELRSALKQKDIECERASVDNKMDKARIMQLELELKNMYAAYAVVNEDITAIDDHRKRLISEKEKHDREAADKLQKAESDLALARRREREEAEKRDMEIAKDFARKEKEKLKREQEARLSARRGGSPGGRHHHRHGDDEFWETTDRASGKRYYVNCNSKQTFWHLPEGGRIVPLPDRAGGEDQGSGSPYVSNSSAAVTVHDPRLDALEARLSRFYARYNPSNLSRVRELAREYANREDALFASLEKKYGPEPGTTHAGYVHFRRTKKGLLRTKTKFDRCWCSVTDNALRKWDPSASKSAEPSSHISLTGTTVKDEGKCKMPGGHVGFAISVTCDPHGHDIFFCTSTKEERDAWLSFLRHGSKAKR